MTKNTTSAPVRVTAAQVAAAIAAYPAQPTGIPNVFEGRAGASRAQIWDYGLISTPESYWTPEDMLALHKGLWKRGIVCQGHGSPVACADATCLGHTCYNAQHTAEHTSTASLKKCWQDKTGARQPHVLNVNGGWQLNPEWVRHLLASGIRIEQGYPGLPLKRSAGKASAGKPAAGKPAAGKPAAGKGSGKPVAPATAPALTAPPVAEVIRVTPADAIK